MNQELSPEDKMLYNAFASDGIIEAEPIPNPEALKEFDEKNARKEVRVENPMIVQVSKIDETTGLPVNSMGRIDWEKLFNPEYLVYPNDDHTKDPLLKADGLRDLALIRGVVSKNVEFLAVTEHMVIVKTKMVFKPNKDDPEGLSWEAVADATPKNVGGTFGKYLSTIAETRSTARCIREALGIRLCTVEEISKEDMPDERDLKPISPEVVVALEHQAEIKGMKNILISEIQKKYPSIDSLNKLNVKQGMLLLTWLNEKPNKKL
jgi:hypothetical protein